MKKQSKFKISWQKVTLVVSVILNLVFITSYVAVEGIGRHKTALAQLNYMTTYFCEDRYDNIMSQLGTNESKNAYAMTVCLRNYKTGKDLDLSPLLKQVNETSPVTNYSLEP